MALFSAARCPPALHDVPVTSPGRRGIKYARTGKKGKSNPTGFPSVRRGLNLLVYWLWIEVTAAPGWRTRKIKKGGCVPPFCAIDQMIRQAMTAAGSPVKSVMQHAITNTAIFPHAKFHSAVPSPIIFPSWSDAQFASAPRRLGAFA